MGKTNNVHFGKFQKYCQQYIDKLGLTEYDVYYSHSEGLSDSFAACEVHYDGCLAMLYLSPDWDDFDVTDKHLKHVAKHEVLELMMSRFFQLAIDRFANEDELSRERHELIRRLEKIL